MTKRRNLKDTLQKERQVKVEKETILATKVALPKTTKDITEIAQQADIMHKEEVSTPSISTTLPSSPQKTENKAVKKAATTSDVVTKERVTVWLPKRVLKTLKIHLATEDKKITEYFTELIKRDLKIK